jgi:hypothetical protein
MCEVAESQVVRQLTNTTDQDLMRLYADSFQPGERRSALGNNPRLFTRQWLRENRGLVSQEITRRFEYAFRSDPDRWWRYQTEYQDLGVEAVRGLEHLHDASRHGRPAPDRRPMTAAETAQISRRAMRRLEQAMQEVDARIRSTVFRNSHLGPSETLSAFITAMLAFVNIIAQQVGQGSDRLPQRYLRLDRTRPRAPCRYGGN